MKVKIEKKKRKKRSPRPQIYPLDKTRLALQNTPQPQYPDQNAVTPHRHTPSPPPTWCGAGKKMPNKTAQDTKDAKSHLHASPTPQTNNILTHFPRKKKENRLSTPPPRPPTHAQTRDMIRCMIPPAHQSEAKQSKPSYTKHRSPYPNAGYANAGHRTERRRKIFTACMQDVRVRGSRSRAALFALESDLQR